MNSKVMKVLGFGISVIALFAPEFVAPAIMEKANDKHLEELIDARIKLAKEEVEVEEK